MSGAAGAQRLDSPEARKAGLDQYLVKLAGEIVAAQNEMVQTATRDPLAATRPLDSSKYPEIAALHRAASTELKSRTAGQSSVAAARAGELSLAAAGHECGDYEHPLPYYARRATTSRSTMSGTISPATFGSIRLRATPAERAPTTAQTTTRVGGTTTPTKALDTAQARGSVTKPWLLATAQHGFSTASRTPRSTAISGRTGITATTFSGGTPPTDQS